MSLKRILLSLTFIGLAAANAWGQDSYRRAFEEQARQDRELRQRTYRERYARPSGDATTVQLPTFNFFTTTTTVSVPDGGTTFMGGIKRLSEGSTSRGIPMLGKTPMLNRLFKNKGIGRNVGAQNVFVTARIINFEEEEEKQVGRVLAQRRMQDGPLYAGNPALDRKADFLSRNVARFDQPGRDDFALPAKPKTPDVDEIRRQNDAARQQRDAEAVKYFAKGQTAEEAGKTGAAKVYYRMAFRRAAGDMKMQIAARLDKLAGASLATSD